MAVVTVCVLILCLSTVSAHENSELYYWREYTGEIPHDALPGGVDADGQDTYIGEGYYHDNGFYIAQIYPGVKEVDLPCYGVKTATINIKILCTESPESFHWVKTSSSTFKQDTADFELVVAGYDGNGNNGIMHVGRMFYQGYVTVGDVTPWKTPHLWFPFNKIERAVNFYEVLVVREVEIEPRLRLGNNMNGTNV
ncbi:hypothetical protein Zmor_012719 [Zophobas morio]|uniref:Uncharacterized protein n=1 Tax=Zophobas morio TaxID=2755281 RepID=A0AA38ICM1_9CUCU|nr:hypothetical protein Zmor_012719 [Zophobas morio]